MISVGNSTMTITTLILLLAKGIVAVTAVDDSLVSTHQLQVAVILTQNTSSLLVEIQTQKFHLVYIQ